MRFVVFGVVLAVVAAPVGRAADKVNVDTTFTMTDLPFFIAEKRGYFRDENLEMNFITFDSAALDPWFAEQAAMALGQRRSQ